ncbi:SDR family NAD(P)-dependent oxidoreductase [Paenibacillus caui]|uniref:SDR family NAD(P)-dependent oxidoreductase n=1 Tax=Paenibacillus caui TaxID=2873927 RepID=UPI001CAA14BE|nr:3-oxoacyl-ACP reductase family protein [Paenibacillus caui]
MLKDKVALVTGSSRGIGKAIAMRFADYQASVVITYHSGKEQAAMLQEEMETKGINALVAPLDVTNEESFKRLYDLIGEHFGRLDILVNNAGIGLPIPLEKISLEDWNHTLNVNLTGTFLGIKHAIPLMKRSDSGRIINISSVAALTGGSFGPHYGASKAGVIGLTKSAARELATYNISVNAIAPGPISSEMTDSLSEQTLAAIIGATPLKRLGQTGEVAELVCQLANPFIDYLTGQTIVIDGGRYMP